MEKRIGILERSKQEEFKNTINEHVFRILVGNPSSIDFRKSPNPGMYRIYKDDKDTGVDISISKGEYFMRDRQQDDIVNSHFSYKE